MNSDEKIQVMYSWGCAIGVEKVSNNNVYGIVRHPSFHCSGRVTKIWKDRDDMINEAYELTRHEIWRLL